MRRSFASLKGLGFILWHARHMAYHVMLGLLWAWFLREQWGQFNPKWIWTAVVGSLLPDADHLNYFMTYGRRESYTQEIWQLLKTRQWRKLVIFIANGHKYNTNLSYHNIYFAGVLLAGALVSSLFDWEVGVILFGAMVFHYLFDIADDIVQLGSINPNWKRWGRRR